MTSTVPYIAPEVTDGTTTSWIPLTTTWSPPKGCATSFFLFPGQPFPYAWDPGYGYFGNDRARCLPDAVTTWWEQDHVNGNGSTSLSIRPLSCPSPYTTMDTTVRAGTSTQVTCCPSGYDLEFCASPLSSGQTINFLSTGKSGPFVVTSTVVKSATSINAVVLVGWNVEATGSTSRASSRSSSGAVATTTVKSSGGLSTGAEAGIGIAAAVGAIGILALIGAFVLLRKRKPKDHASGRYESVNNSSGVPGGDVRQVHEMAAPQERPKELPSSY